MTGRLSLNVRIGTILQSNRFFNKPSRRLISDVGYWILDVGYWMLDVGCWILDIGCWMLDIGC
jgi:hypothetical protein